MSVNSLHVGYFYDFWGCFGHPETPNVFLLAPYKYGIQYLLVGYVNVYNWLYQCLGRNLWVRENITEIVNFCK